MKLKLAILLSCMSLATMALAQASGGQIRRKTQSNQRTTTSVNPRRNIPQKEDNRGLAELEKIRKQGETQEQNIQEELLKTDDNSRKEKILITASSTFESSKDYERAIKFYNQYLQISHRLSSDDLDNLAEIYSHFADFLSEYKLEEYRKDVLLKAVDVYHRMGDIFPPQNAYATYRAAEMSNKLDRTKGDNLMLKTAYHYLMANAFIYGKNKALAKEYANKILSIDPEYAPAQQIRDL